MEQIRYDIFISYRRKGGSEKAQLVKSELLLRGVSDERIFLDTHNLYEGDFVKKIQTSILQSRYVVLIVSEGCFDEVRETDFWYMEIKEALAQAKPIIPIFFDGISSLDPLPVPIELAALKRMNGVAYQHEYASAAFDKLMIFIGKSDQPYEHVGNNRQGCILKYKGCLISITLAAILLIVITPLLRFSNPSSENNMAYWEETVGQRQEGKTVSELKTDEVVMPVNQNMGEHLIAQADVPQKAENNNYDKLEIEVVGSAKQAACISPVFDADESYAMLPIKISYPLGRLTTKNRLSIWLYMIDCYTGDTLSEKPLIFYEGKRYHKKRMKKDKHFCYPIGSQQLNKKQAFVIDTIFHVKLPQNIHVKLDYKIVVEDYRSILFVDDYLGSCLRLQPFKFLQPPLWDVPDDSVFDSFKSAIRSGKPASNILKPYVDFSVNRANVRRYNDMHNYYIINKTEVLCNLAAAYHMEHKQDTTMYLMEILNDCCIDDYRVKRLEAFLKFKSMIMRYDNLSSVEKTWLDNVQDSIMTIADNKAVLYTELAHLGQRADAVNLVKEMRDDSPVKWYLMAILWSNRVVYEKVEKEEPYYITCLRRCFKLDGSFRRFYIEDAQFSDELRNRYAYFETDFIKTDSTREPPRNISDGPHYDELILKRKGHLYHYCPRKSVNNPLKVL